MKVVPIQSFEVGLISDLAEKIWPDTFIDILTDEQIRYMLDWMYNPDELSRQIDNGHQFYLLKKENLALGFIGIQPKCPEKNELKIHKLYVLPEVQGKGAGRLLINKAIAVALDCGCSRIILNVNRFNRAVSFYRHLGFKVLREEDIDIGNGYWMEDYVMGRMV